VDKNIVFLDKCRPFSVRRITVKIQRGVVRQVRAVRDSLRCYFLELAPVRARRGLCWWFLHRVDARDFVRSQVALPACLSSHEPDCFAVIGKYNTIERQLLGFVFGPVRFGYSCGKLLVVERGFTRAEFGVDQDKFFGIAAQVVSIPETCVLREPVGRDS